MWVFCPCLFPKWTRNFASLSSVFLSALFGDKKENSLFCFISLGLPSPLQLLHICALTPVNGHTDASCVPADLQTALRLQNTCGLTRARSLTSARYVNWSSHSRGIWIGTCACTNMAACENAGGPNYKYSLVTVRLFSHFKMSPELQSLSLLYKFERNMLLFIIVIVCMLFDCFSVWKI